MSLSFMSVLSGELGMDSLTRGSTGQLSVAVTKYWRRSSLRSKRFIRGSGLWAFWFIVQGWLS